MQSNGVHVQVHGIFDGVFAGISPGFYTSSFAIQDGGYHVPFAHKGLASGLQMDSYTSTLYERLSMQSCGPQRAAANQDKRLGEPPTHPSTPVQWLVRIAEHDCWL